MARLVLLMRHGEAEGMAVDDAQRALTAAGEAQAAASARYLTGYAIERVVASPYRRAQQTAALVSQELGGGFSSSELLIPDADPVIALQSLAESTTDNLLLVCHMPLVSRMAGWLLEGEGAWGPGFATADIAVIEAEWIAAGTGLLRAMLGPQGRL
ncbi:phosphohistidine phosphatase SixA [Aestuariirhabdus sp. LZHN29]|uniref:phosphohistidine phosphatase SixA n=1 Tax=Aestuariirhabdus sp. LZHN29 TaxID=3417462 RepID=UPI003CF08F42